MFKGPYTCSLLKNGEVLKRQRLLFYDDDYPEPWHSKMWFLFILGFVSVMVGAYFHLPSWSVLVIFVPLGVFNVVKASKIRPRIEELNVKQG